MEAKNLRVDAYGHLIDDAMQDSAREKELSKKSSFLTMKEHRAQHYAAESRADALREKQVELNNQLAILDYQNEYNSPLEVNKRRIAAGFNPNLEGEANQSVPLSDAQSLAPSGNISGQDLAALSNSSLQAAQLAGSLITGAVGIITSVKQIKILKESLKGLELDNLNKGIRNSEAIYNVVSDYVVNNLVSEVDESALGDPDTFCEALFNNAESLRNILFGSDSSVSVDMVSKAMSRAKGDLSNMASRAGGLSAYRQNLLSARTSAAFEESSTLPLVKYQAQLSTYNGLLSHVLDTFRISNDIEYQSYFTGLDRATLDLALGRSQVDVNESVVHVNESQSALNDANRDLAVQTLSKNKPFVQMAHMMFDLAMSADTPYAKIAAFQYLNDWSQHFIADRSNATSVEVANIHGEYYYDAALMQSLFRATTDLINTADNHYLTKRGQNITKRGQNINAVTAIVKTADNHYLTTRGQDMNKDSQANHDFVNYMGNIVDIMKVITPFIVSGL